MTFLLYLEGHFIALLRDLRPNFLFLSCYSGFFFFFYHPLLTALKTLVSCQFSGLNCYLRQIESSQVYLLGLSNRNAELVPLVMHVWLPLDGRNS